MQVGEEKIVMGIGRVVRQQPNAKPYIHDFLLSMALAEVINLQTSFCLFLMVGGSPMADLVSRNFFIVIMHGQCSIARRGFERGTVSEGFEALARAQLLLRSKRSLAKLNLLTEVHSMILPLYALLF